MTWSKTLRDWTFGEAEDSASDVVAADLCRLVAELREEAHQLEGDAELAPNQSAELALHDLARERAAAADHLARVLGREATLQPADAAPFVPAGDSQWARLVQDLERLRTVRARLLEVGARLDGSQTELSTAVEDVFRVAESHLGRLRALIARADPQALN